MAGSGSIAVMIFPNMIKHMFLKDGYRGQQSVNNLRNTDFSEYLMRVKIFYALNGQYISGFHHDCHFSNYKKIANTRKQHHIP